MIDLTVLRDGPTWTETSDPLPEAPAAATGVGVRRLRGDRMTTLAGLYDEFAAALQFPEWFGANLDAFDECLRDVDLPECPGGAVVLVVTRADEMLSAEPARREWFPEAVADAVAVRTGRGLGRIAVVFSRAEEGTADPWWRTAAPMGA